jgi:hypothetical protein
MEVDEQQNNEGSEKEKVPRQDKVDEQKEKNKKNEPEQNNILQPNSELKQLKDEITNLKKLHIKDQLEIQEIKEKYQKEIDSLKEQFKSLLIQINELKKNKKGNNNIIDDSDDNMENDQAYSVECINNKKDTEILQGAEKTNIDIVIRNNSNKKYPKNTYLVSDTKNSLLLCEKVELNELEPNQQQGVSILFKNLKYVSKGIYNCIVKLQIENKIYNSFFELKVKILENNDFAFPQRRFDIDFSERQNPNSSDNMEKNILDFRAAYELYDNDYINDYKIEEALKKNNFDFSKAFASLFD